MQSHRELVVDGVGLSLESLSRPIDWAALFGNANPVEFEIGMGKGTFITEAAKSRPQTNFFGLEYANWYWRYCSDRLRRNGCFNARTARAEAHFFIREYVPDASIDVMHIYFPDPWHNKRRLIQPPFLTTVQRVLKPGGMLKVVTDHPDYWQQIEATVRGSQLAVIDYARPAHANQAEVVGTNFERKYAREGRPFHAIAAVKQ